MLTLLDILARNKLGGGTVSSIQITQSREQGEISKYIYGQFAEHLERCIRRKLGSVRLYNGSIKANHFRVQVKY